VDFEREEAGAGGIFDAFSNSDDGEDGVAGTIEMKTPPRGDNQDAIIDNPFEGGQGDAHVSPPDEARAPAYDTTAGGAVEQEPFAPSKAPAAAILEKGPRKLNKTFILYVLCTVFSAFVIFTLFVSPLSGKKKAEKTKKPNTTAVTPVDYSALVPRKERDDLPARNEAAEDDAILNSLPPVDPEYRYVSPAEQAAEPAAASGGGGGSSHPDTRGDRLQSKSISGIKGITPTQSQYLGGGGIPNQPYALPPTPANPYAPFGMPSKEAYTAQTLAGYPQNAPAYPSGSSYQNQNDQDGKMNFYNAGRENAGNGVWLGPAAVWQGTIFEAVLTSAINTDLPGEVTAVISKNIYSSLDGRYLLIPQNSRLYGSYSSSISYSQSRVQVGWHTLIRPDGYAVSLGNMAATDAQGAAGVRGVINDHLFQYVKALALMSVFNIINSEFAYTAAGTNNQYVQNVLADSQSVTATLGSKLIDRAMDVQPTITIKAGLKINIVANTTLALPPLPPYDVTMPYRR
jgi:type IV secretion system protein VirB10